LRRALQVNPGVSPSVIGRRVVERLAYLACVATNEPKYPRQSRVAPALFRVTGALVKAFGGRLESRLVAFARPAAREGSSDDIVEKVLGALSAAGLSPRATTRLVSRTEALASDDLREFAIEGKESFELVQVFVLMHQYWAGIPVTQEAIRRHSENHQPG